jgi:hypothetical protein
MEKKSNSGGKGKVIKVVESANWESEEVLEIEHGIEGCVKLMTEFRLKLLEITQKREGLEAKVRRAKILLNDRTIMLAKSQSALKNTIAEKMSLKAKMNKVK